MAGRSVQSLENHTGSCARSAYVAVNSLVGGEEMTWRASSSWALRHTFNRDAKAELPPRTRFCFREMSIAVESDRNAASSPPLLWQSPANGGQEVIRRYQFGRLRVREGSGIEVSSEMPAEGLRVGNEPCFHRLYH